MRPGGSRPKLDWILLGLVAVLAACGSTVSGAPGSELGRVTERADRGWAPFTSVIDTTGMKTQSDQPPEAQVSIVEHTSIGYIAAGDVNGGLAIWRSDDFQVFEPLYNEVCCARYIRPEVIAEFDRTIVLGGSGRVPQGDGEDVERAFLLRSDDQGRTWTSIEHPIFRDQATRIDRIEVIGDTVIVDAVDDTCCGTPESLAVRSTDLVRWTKLVLPGRSSEDWPWYQVDSKQIIATASRDDGPGGISTRYVMWRSVDAGRTFQVLPDVDLAGGAPILVEGKLVRFPESFYDHASHRDPVGLSSADPGGSFEQYPPDVGQWGDGFLRVGRFASAGGESYAVLRRELRASPHYCYADATTCKTWESSLVVTTDGINWRDVVGPNMSRQWFHNVDVRADGEIVLWSTDGQERTIAGYRWLGADPPTRRNPPGYPPPSIPLPLYGYQDLLPIGTEVRYVLGTGGCGGMYIERTLWEPIDPLPDPIPATWPYRPVMIEDGPEGYLYGRVERVSSSRIEFSIEGIGTVATFRPAPTRESFCG